MFFNFILIWNLFFASLVILNRNLLYSIICLIFLIVGSCFMLFCLEIEFLTFILLLIYIGAIAVLFLFMMMMLRLNDEKIKKSFFFILSIKYLVYIIIIFKINFMIFYLNKKICITLNAFSYEFLKYNDDLNIFYNHIFKIENDIIFFFSIFTQKFLFFLIIGFVLLFAMIGSISLCLREKKN